MALLSTGASAVREPASAAPSRVQTVARQAASLYRGHTAATWAERYRVRTRQLQNARHVLYARGSVVEALNLACVVYGHCGELWRKARCESRYFPGARNASGAAGLFQFLPSTFASTPFGRFSIYSPYASALAAGWMHASGRGGEWQCT